VRQIRFRIVGITDAHVQDWQKRTQNSNEKAVSQRQIAHAWPNLSLATQVLLTLTAAATLIGVASRTSQGHVQNDFRPPANAGDSCGSDVPGWIHAGSSADGNLNRRNGSCFLMLGGGFYEAGSASWSTTLYRLIRGKAYHLRFRISNESNPKSPKPPLSITVKVTSGPLTSIHSYTVNASHGDPWSAWQTEVQTFRAAQSTAVLEFSVTNQQYDIGLDSVSVSE